MMALLVQLTGLLGPLCRTFHCTPGGGKVLDFLHARDKKGLNIPYSTVCPPIGTGSWSLLFWSGCCSDNCRAGHEGRNNGQKSHYGAWWS